METNETPVEKDEADVWCCCHALGCLSVVTYESFITISKSYEGWLEVMNQILIFKLIEAQSRTCHGAHQQSKPLIIYKFIICDRSWQIVITLRNP
jgi:hypothetical protein